MDARVSIQFSAYACPALVSKIERICLPQHYFRSTMLNEKNQLHIILVYVTIRVALVKRRRSIANTF